MIRVAKRLETFSLIILFIFLTGFTDNYADRVSAEPAAKNILWEVKSNTNLVYLFGSFHVASEKMYPLNQRIEKAFEESDCLVVEADVGDTEKSRKAQEIMMKKAMYLQGRSLKENIPEELYVKLIEEVKRFGMGAQHINVMKPWFLSMTITVLQLAKLGHQPKFGMDLYFLNKARNKKEILELESLEFSINMMSGFSPELQILYLEDTLEGIPAMKEQMEELLAYWREGNVENFTEFFFKLLDESPKLKPLYKEMFSERNKKMAVKIEEYLKDEKTYFVVVGAGHLIGKDGIINILENKEYKIEQL